MKTFPINKRNESKLHLCWCLCGWINDDGWTQCEWVNITRWLVEMIIIFINVNDVVCIHEQACSPQESVHTELTQRERMTERWLLKQN